MIDRFRQYFHSLPIKGKLLLVTMTIVFSGFVIIGAAVVYYNSNAARADLRHDLASIGKLIADRSSAAVVIRDEKAATENLNALSMITSVSQAYLLNAKGEVLAYYPSNIKHHISWEFDVPDGFSFDADNMIYSSPIILKSEIVGRVIITADLTEYYTRRNHLILIVAGILVIAFLITYLLSLRLIKYVTRPVLSLTSAARQVTLKNDLTVRAEKLSDDETGILVDTFNEMLRVIESQNSEKKNLIEVLKNSRSMLNMILDTIPQSIFWKDTNSVYLGCNKVFAAAAGLTSTKEIIGKKASELGWTKGIAEELRRVDVSVIESKETKKNIVLPLTPAKGKVIWVDITKVPILDTDGTVSMILGIMTDITDRRQSEEKIRQSESRYKLLLNSITDYIYSVEIQNGVPVNTRHHPGCLTVTGYTPDEFVADKRLWINMVYPDDQPIVEHYADPLMMGEEIPPIEHRIINKNGTVRWIRNTYVLKLNPAGEVTGYDGLISDITERKRAEEELRLYRDHLEILVRERTAELELEKEKAESADRLKSAFLATMSHELRTPLNSIIGFTGILLQEKPGPLNAEQKKQLGMAQNSTRHLLSLINDVLDISKIEAGQLKVNIEEFSLPEVIEKVSELTTPLAQKKALTLTTTIGEGVGLMKSDRLRVQQILINIVNNAIKFTETGSIRIRATRTESTITIAVTDTGIGIEPEKVDVLFKPFMQIDTGLTRKHEGTGLGLSICKKLLQLLDGSITVASEFGKGSTFTIYLPMERAEG